MAVGIVAGFSVLALLAARFVRAEGPPGWPLGPASPEDFWRASLPWPHGVQEDAEIAWHVPREEPDDGAQSSGSAPGGTADLVPPTRPQGRFRGRSEERDGRGGGI
jgi:hypothetical protein